MNLCIDTETTISNKGNPFDQRNKLCLVGLKFPKESWLLDIEYSLSPHDTELKFTQGVVDMSNLIIGFNLKFDLHWIRRYGIDISDKRVWDCQVVHFILTGQKESYPSLNSVAIHYGIETKIDEVYDLYWSQGIDTPEVPLELLKDYLQKDLDITYQVYLKQVEELEARPELKNLVSLHNQDLTVLEEMEFNGITFDETECTKLGEELNEKIKTLDVELNNYHGRDDLNLRSNDHLSAFLYGGTLNLQRRVSRGTFKTGSRKGEEKMGWESYEVTLPRMVKPIKGSQLKKEGFYSTDEGTLKSLKSSIIGTKIINLMLQKATDEKRLGTYYVGLVKLNKELGWKPNLIHGTLNQCVARTGRLSSSKPNLQNFDGNIKQLFYSRYTYAPTG